MQEQGNQTHDDLQNYKGFWFPKTHVEGIISYRNHFEARNSDIYVATVPKSGTTWLKALVFALVNRDNHKNTKQGHPLLAKNPHELVPFLEQKIFVKNDENQFTDMPIFSCPRLYGTHMPFQLLSPSIKDSSSKIVYLCRDPKDTFISYWHFLNKVGNQSQVSIEEEFEKYSNGVSMFGPFWDHILGYWKESIENPHKVLFMKFEEMKKETDVQIRRLAKFLDCPITKDEEMSNLTHEILELCSFENLSRLEVNKKPGWLQGLNNKIFFRHGEVGDWKNYLTPDISNRLDEICEQKLKGSGLSF